MTPLTRPKNVLVTKLNRTIQKCVNLYNNSRYILFVFDTNTILKTKHMCWVNHRQIISIT